MAEAAWSGGEQGRTRELTVDVVGDRVVMQWQFEAV